MPTQQEAKSLFRKTLGLMLANVLWPPVAMILSFVSIAVGGKQMWWISLIMLVIMLALFIWLAITIWKAAPSAGTTPWVWLWLFLPIYGLFIIGMLILEPLKYIADNLPTSSRLPLTWDMIKKAMGSFKEIFQTTIKTSLWYVYLSASMGMLAAITTIWPQMTTILVIGGMAYFFVSVWITIRLLLEVSAYEDNKRLTGTENKEAQNKMLSYIWLTILIILVVLGIPAVLTGVCFLIFIALGMSGMHLFNAVSDSGLNAITASNVVQIIALVLVLFACILGSIIWMVYKSNQITFAIPSLVLQNIKGYAAIKESARIVKGRWWGLAWKMQLWGMVVGIFTIAAALAVMLLIVVLAFAVRSMPYGQAIIQFFSQALQGFIQMALTPLALLFLIRLYRAFYNTAK